MHIVLFFTYDISIRDWIKSGLFERENKTIQTFKQEIWLQICLFT